MGKIHDPTCFLSMVGFIIKALRNEVHFQMDDEKQEAGQSTATDTAAEATPETGTEESEAQPTEEIQASQEARTFTQEQVNELIQERLRRASEANLKRYGVQSEDEFTSVFEKGRSYDELKTQYDTLLAEKKALADQITLSRNKILAEKEDDVLTYFKGKGLEMSDEALKQVLLNHPEWVAKEEQMPKFTTVVPLGADKTEGFPEMSEEDRAAKLFGFDKFV